MALKSTTGWGDNNGTDEFGWNGLNLGLRYWTNSPYPFSGAIHYAMGVGAKYTVSHFYTDDANSVRFVQEYNVYGVDFSGHPGYTIK